MQQSMKSQQFTKALQNKSNNKLLQPNLVQNTLNTFVQQITPVAQAFNYKNESKFTNTLQSQTVRLPYQTKFHTEIQAPIGSFIDKKVEKENYKQQNNQNNEIRKSFDLINDISTKNEINKLQSRIMELEDQNINQKIDLKLKDDQIIQLEQQLKNQQEKNILQDKERNKQLEDIKKQLITLQNQCEMQNQQLQQLQYLEIEINEWKEKFFNLNREYHNNQEQLTRQKVELELALKKKENSQKWCLKQ